MAQEAPMDRVRLAIEVDGACETAARLVGAGEARQVDAHLVALWTEDALEYPQRLPVAQCRLDQVAACLEHGGERREVGGERRRGRAHHAQRNPPTSGRLGAPGMATGVRDAAGGMVNARRFC